MRDLAPLIDEIVARLRRARSVLFITGAGISADSGLPTYRDIGGLYDSPGRTEGIPVEEVLSGDMFARRPEITWRQMHAIETSFRGATENRAHTVIAEAEHRFERVWVLTQNVDGLHRRAGSKNVIDIHGDLHDILCTECEYRTSVDDYSGLAALPLCPDCNAIMRPNVVLFGELLPEDKLALMSRELRRGFDVVFSIGTTSVFPYIARPVLDAKISGCATVEVNPNDTLISSEVDVKVPASAAQACDLIWSRLMEGPTEWSGA